MTTPPFFRAPNFRMTTPTPITHVRSYDELAADYEACLADNAALREALAWIMRTHVKDGAIINSQHTDTINAALLTGKEGK